MKTKLVFKTALPTYNDITHWSYSKRSDGYYKAKRNHEVLLLNELETDPGNIQAVQDAINNGLQTAKNIACTYVWHTTHKYDLSNLSFGTKFIEDTLNNAGIWEDDSNVYKLNHVLTVDTRDFVEVIITF